MLKRGEKPPLWVHLNENEESDEESVSLHITTAHDLRNKFTSSSMNRSQTGPYPSFVHQDDLTKSERQNSEASVLSDISKCSSSVSWQSMASSHSTLSSMTDGVEPATPDSDHSRLSPLLAEFPPVPTRVPTGHPTLHHDCVEFTDPFRPRNLSPRAPEYRRLDLCNDLGHRRRRNTELNAPAQPHVFAAPAEPMVLSHQPRPVHARTFSKPQINIKRNLTAESELHPTRPNSGAPIRRNVRGTSPSPKTPTARVADAKGKLINRISVQSPQYTKWEATALELCAMILEYTGFGSRRVPTERGLSQTVDNMQLVRLMMEFLSLISAGTHQGKVGGMDSK